MKHLPKIIFFFMLILVVGICIAVKKINTSLKEPSSKQKSEELKKEVVYLITSEKLA